MSVADRLSQHTLVGLLFEAAGQKAGSPVHCSCCAPPGRSKTHTMFTSRLHCVMQLLWPRGAQQIHTAFTCSRLPCRCSCRGMLGHSRYTLCSYAVAVPFVAPPCQEQQSEQGLSTTASVRSVSVHGGSLSAYLCSSGAARNTRSCS